MARRMTVHRDGNAIYDIVIQSSFDYLGQEVKALSVEGRKLCIVTDSNVAPLYLEQVEEQLRPCCGQTDAFVFPAGEEHKNLDTVKSLYEFLILRHYDRGNWRSLRICGSNLFKRNSLYSGADNPAFAG